MVAFESTAQGRLLKRDGFEAPVNVKVKDKYKDCSKRLNSNEKIVLRRYGDRLISCKGGCYNIVDNGNRRLGGRVEISSERMQLYEKGWENERKEK